jgi:hypothetical protein
MPRKLIKQYTADVFFPNHDEIQDFVADREMLYETIQPMVIKKFNLIEDPENKSRFLVGDFEGIENFAPWTIKVFLYDDGKVLGSLKYLAQFNFPEEKIEATYTKGKKDNMIIHGICRVIRNGEQKQGFLVIVY